MTAYIVKPRTDGTWSLISPRLPYVMWWSSDLLAISYATWHCREQGGSIAVMNTKGHPVIVETVPGTGDGTQYGRQATPPQP